jgi:transcriptional regulator with XRE-family HTH domain
MHKTAIDGSKAREIMDGDGLSVTEVARRMSVTRATVYNLLKGNNTTLDVLSNFAAAIGVNPLDVLVTEGFPPAANGDDDGN